MTKEDIQKIVSMIQTMPYGYKLLRKLLFDYASTKEQNEQLIATNINLIEDIRQYQRLLEEKQNTEIIFH